MQGKEKSFSLRMSATLVYGVWLTYTIDQWSMVYGGAEVLGKTGERDKISSKHFCVGRSKFSLEVQPRYLPAERDGSKMGRVTLYNKGLFTYYVSQNQGDLGPTPPSAMVIIWLNPPPSSAFVSICPTSLLYYNFYEDLFT